MADSSGAQKVILITGASTGFGAQAARLLAEKGHIVFAGVREHEKAEIADAKQFAETHSVSLYPVLLDVTQTPQVDSTVTQILNDLKRHGKSVVDVLIHNAGIGCMGPAESFTAEEMAQFFDINVLGAQRVNRAMLPHMRAAGRGLLMWTCSSGTRGGGPPFLAPYFASKAALDSLAVSYAGELSKWGIETTIILPGAYTSGTKFFQNVRNAKDESGVAAQYHAGPYAGMDERVYRGLLNITPPDADPGDVAKAMVRVVEMEHGQRPLRLSVSPYDDGTEEVNRVEERVRSEFIKSVGLDDVLDVKH